MTPEKIKLARQLYDEGNSTVQQIAETLGVSRRRIYRSLKIIPRQPATEVSR